MSGGHVAKTVYARITRMLTRPNQRFTKFLAKKSFGLSTWAAGHTQLASWERRQWKVEKTCWLSLWDWDLCQHCGPVGKPREKTVGIEAVDMVLHKTWIDYFDFLRQDVLGTWGCFLGEKTTSWPPGRQSGWVIMVDVFMTPLLFRHAGALMVVDVWVLKAICTASDLRCIVT